MIGETFGSYRITRKIGEGGMGAVYLAEHTLLGRKVAIKVLLPEHSQSQDLIDRFFNEAKTAASLKHPALVDVFDYGIHPSGSAYLVMDFLEGENLGNRLARVAPLPNETAIDFGRQVARGMEAAHSRGIVHRDLKPDNVFLVPDPEDPERDRVKILDFGIAKLLGAPKGSKGATSTGMVLGTPLFMAPEQCRGAGVVDHRADIYSLGCILYFMVCARPPFDYAGVGEILGAHLFEPVKAPRTINPEVSEGLEAVILMALAKKPEERFQTMAALATELARLLGRTGAATRPSTFPPATIAVIPPPGFTGAARVATPAPPGAPPATTPPSAVPPPAASVPPPLSVLAPPPVVAPAPAAPPSPTPDPVPAPRYSALTPTTLREAASELGTGAPPSRPRRLLWPLGVAFVAGAGIAAVAVLWPRQPPPSPTPQAAFTHPPTSQVTVPPAPAARPTVQEPARQPRTVATPPAASKPPASTPPATAQPSTQPAPSPRPAARKPDALDRALAFRQRGEEREAFIELRRYLQGTNLPPARRAEAEQQLMGLQRKFGEVEITCEVSGADVFVDGRHFGQTPLPRALVVVAGQHELVVTKSGYQTIRRPLSVTAGGRQFVSVRFPR